jgi:hypothetical protein
MMSVDEVMPVPPVDQRFFGSFFQKRTASFLRFSWLPLCLIAGLLSVALGQDASWDLQNYHLYNAFALLRHRHDIDIAQSQSFLNPILDVPLYLLTLTFAHAPRAVAFCMGLPFGVLAFFALRIGFRLFGHDRLDLPAVLVAVLFGLSGTATAAQIGLATNEIPVAALVIAGFDFLLIGISAQPLAVTPLVLAGLLTGLAVGGKLTALPYAAGLALAAIAGLPPRRWLTAILAIGAAGMLASMLTGGLWMAHLARTYGNPIFPFDNNIFRSPWAGPWEYNDVRFFPHGPLQAVLYPFWWARLNNMRVTDAPFADPRFAALFLVVALVLLAVVLRRRVGALLPPPQWRAVLVFWLVSYILWEKLFSIYRYAIPLEITGGVLFVGALRVLLPARPRLAAAAAAALTAGVAVATIYPDWGHIAFQAEAVPVALPTMPARSLVVSISPTPASFLAVRAPKQTVFVGAINNFEVADTTLTWRLISSTIENWRGPIEIIEPVSGDPVSRDVVAAEFNLVATDRCQTILAAWNHNALRLCTAHLLGGAPGYQPAISFGFAAGDASDDYAGAGWAAPEAWGRWSMASDATITLPINSANTNPLLLTVLAYGLPSATTPGRHAEIFANGQLIARWALSPFPKDYQATIPNLNGAAKLTLRFHILDPATPAEQQTLGNARALGIAMMRLSVQEILSEKP